jgi:hypothetical protein
MALTEAAIRAMADDWFRKLDEHVREVELLPFLVSEGLKQNWPDYKVESLGDFEGWYQRALRLFFDEIHTVKEVTPTIDAGGNSATVKVVVNWEASTWNPGDRNSKRIKMDAYQTWIVVPGPAGTPQIKQIDVDNVVLAPGSATL